MATILIAGGTGLIGKALGQALLQKGYKVIILSRQTSNKQPVTGNFSYATWNVEHQTIDIEAIAKADYIIHLAGAGMADKRWTKKRKQEIVDSRVNSCNLIVESLKTIPNKVKAVISASAIGWYGEDLAPNTSSKGAEGNSRRMFVESDPAAEDFPGQTCKQWEESIEPVTVLGKRLVKLRTGIVLSKDGGALKEFLKPQKFGLAAILGSGKQIMSWIHIDDLVNMYIGAIEDEKRSGVYNAVAPNPVSNKELTLQLAKCRKKFFIEIHIPVFILKLILGEMSIEVLKSARVSNTKICQTGFTFLYPTPETALKQLIKNS